MRTGYCLARAVRAGVVFTGSTLLAGACADPTAPAPFDATDGAPSSRPAQDAPVDRVVRRDAGGLRDASRWDGMSADSGSLDGNAPTWASPADAGDCTDGERDCGREGVLLCERGRWVAGERCSGNRPHCSAGRCIECLRGQVECDGQAARECGDQGKWQLRTICSGEAPACLDGDCVECAPGRDWCVERTPWLCRSDGSASEQAPCGVGERCDRGACVPDEPPAVEILQPEGDVRIVLEEWTSWSFVAARVSAFDAVDGEIAEHGRVVWWSRRDGRSTFIGYGTTVSLPLSVEQSCVETTHDVTVQVNDSAYNQVSATFRVTIVPPC